MCLGFTYLPISSAGKLHFDGSGVKNTYLLNQMPIVRNIAAENVLSRERTTRLSVGVCFFFLDLTAGGSATTRKLKTLNSIDPCLWTEHTRFLYLLVNG